MNSTTHPMTTDHKQAGTTDRWTSGGEFQCADQPQYVIVVDLYLGKVRDLDNK